MYDEIWIDYKHLYFTVVFKCLWSFKYWQTNNQQTKKQQTNKYQTIKHCLSFLARSRVFLWSWAPQINSNSRIFYHYIYTITHRFFYYITNLFYLFSPLLFHILTFFCIGYLDSRVLEILQKEKTIFFSAYWSHKVITNSTSNTKSCKLPRAILHLLSSKSFTLMECKNWREYRKIQYGHIFFTAMIRLHKKMRNEYKDGKGYPGGLVWGREGSEIPRKSNPQDNVLLEDLSWGVFIITFLA